MITIKVSKEIWQVSLYVVNGWKNETWGYLLLAQA